MHGVIMEKQFTNRKLITYTCITLIWILFIVSFSLQSGEESSQTSGGVVSALVNVLFPQGFAYVEQLEFLIRKLAHFTEYFILGVLVLQTLKQTRCPNQILVGVIVCVLVASCDETIQLFSGGRSGKLEDVLLDGIGALCGILFMDGLRKFVNKKVF